MLDTIVATDSFKADCDVTDILQVETSEAWLIKASQHLDILLLDHAHAERKAAQSALRLLHHYPVSDEFIDFLVTTSREEMQHLSQVVQLLKKRGLSYNCLKPCRYGQFLLGHRHQHDPERFLDSLIIAALIEARSCERFSKIVAYIPEDIARFYQGLVACEQNHFTKYLYFAHHFFDSSKVNSRISDLADLEAVCISKPEHVFRFHSGVPA